MDEIAVQEFVKAIKEPTAFASDIYSATVSRVDKEGVVWVNIHGSDKETPTASVASEVNRGDVVNVSWRNNKLYIDGNYSNPSAGLERTIKNEAVAENANKKATTAMESAETARVAAEQAVADAGRAATAAQNAQQSASSAGISASQAQAASEAAQMAALATITTDTIHYLATDLATGVTTSTPGWTTTVQTMTAVNKYLWTYHTYTSASGVSTDTNPVITGVFGEKGADGTSVTILGSYNTLAELETAHPTGSLGDAYMVAGDLYVWNGSAWENVGQIQGPQGADGTSVTITSIAYAVTADENQPQTYPYTTAPTVPEGSWLWTRVAFSDGNVAITKSKQGVSGTNGVSPTVTTSKSGDVTTITIVDANGTHTATITDGADGEDGTSPTVSKTGSTVTITDASGHSVTVSDGTDGQSIKGDDGDDAYLHIAWANSSDGTVDFSTTVATNKLYMGTYTDHTATDSIVPSKYKWVKVKGEQGVQGIQGNDGSDGADGISVTAVQPQYYLHLSPTATQSEIDTWTWSLSLSYVVSKYIWTRDKITYSDNSIGYSTAIYNEALTQSCYDAATALGLIQEQQEYFWHDSLGAHVLGSTSGYRTDITSTGMNVVEVSTGDSVAQFGATTRVGKDDEQNVNVTSTAVEVRDGNVVNASFGADEIQVGQDEGAHIVVTSDSISGHADIDYFSISASGERKTQWALMSPTAKKSSVGRSSLTIDLDNDPTAYESIWSTLPTGTRFKIVVYTTYRALTFTDEEECVKGTPSPNYGNVGNAECGYDGGDTLAFYPTLYPSTSTANGPWVSRTYLLYVYKETNSAFYRFGQDVATSGGDYSFLMGEGTKASYENQLAIGKYNADVANGVFIIGNGANSANRSNAFVVDTDGYIYPCNTKQIDWVIEKGTSGNWRYEKYASGKVEAWGTDTVFISGYTQIGTSPFYRSTNNSASIPIGIFPSTPTHLETFIHGSSTVFVSFFGSPQSSTSISLQAIRTNDNEGNATIHFHAIYYPSDY